MKDTVKPKSGPAVPMELQWPTEVHSDIVKQFTGTMKNDALKIEYDWSFDEIIRKLFYDKGKSEVEKMKDFLKHDTYDPDCNNMQWCQSVYQYDKLVASINEFNKYKRRHPDTNRSYQLALKEFNDKYLAGIRIQPYTYISDEDILQRLPKKEANAGYTYFQTGKKNKADNVVGSLRKLRQRKDLILNNEFEPDEYPILPQHRTQGNPPIKDDGSFDYDEGSTKAICKHKTRLIHMNDFFNYLVMNEFQIPWQNAIGTTGWYAGGMEIEHVLLKHLLRILSYYPHFLVLDASSYDAHLQGWLMKDVRNVERSHFIFSGQQDKLYDWCTEAMIHKKIYDGNKLVQLHSGMGSGFPWTSTGDTSCNIVQVLTAFIALSRNIDKVRIVSMGDDIIICSQFPVEDKKFREELRDYLFERFAYEINYKKANYGKFPDKMPEFLSRYFTLQGTRRQWRQFIAKGLYPERHHKYDEYNALLKVKALALMYPLDLAQVMNIVEFKRNHVLNLFELEEAAIKGMVPGAVTYQLLYGNLKGWKDVKGISLRDIR